MENAKWIELVGEGVHFCTVVNDYLISVDYPNSEFNYCIGKIPKDVQPAFVECLKSLNKTPGECLDEFAPKAEAHTLDWAIENGIISREEVEKVRKKVISCEWMPWER